MKKSLLTLGVTSLCGLAAAQTWNEVQPVYVPHGTRYSENTSQWFTAAVQAVNTTGEAQQFSSSFYVIVPKRVWNTSSWTFGQPSWHAHFATLTCNGTGAEEDTYHYYNSVSGTVGPYSSVYGYGWITTKSGSQEFVSYIPTYQTAARQRYVPEKDSTLEPGYSVNNGA